MKRQERDLVLDFLIFVAAVLGCLILTVFGTFLSSPEVITKVYREDFGFSVFSFGISYLLLLDIKYLLSFKIPFPDWSNNILWILTIILGTCLFTHFTDRAAFFDTAFFLRRFFLILIFILIPSAIFRLTINFVIHFWPQKEGSRISVAK